MEMHYFSWLRQRMGRANETIELPQSVASIQQLKEWLLQKDERYKVLFTGPVNISVNSQLIEDWQKPCLRGNDSIEIFSPMAGG